MAHRTGETEESAPLPKVIERGFYPTKVYLLRDPTGIEDLKL